jgi:DNA modification methylase
MQTPFAPAPYWSSAVDALRLYRGDCRDVLASLPRETFACCVTSPPYYGLRDYGLEPSVWGGVKGCRHEWRDAGTKTVDARPDHSGGSPLGTRGAQSFAKAAGSVLSFGSTCRHCNAWRGSLGLEPTPQLYVAHLVECLRHVRDALHPLGTLWLNLGDSFAGAASNQNGGGLDGKVRGGNRERGRITGGPPPGFKQKDLLGVPWRVAFALQDEGWYLRMDIIWEKANPMPESVTDRPAKSHEYVFLLSKAKTYYYDHEAVKEPCVIGDGGRQRAALRGAFPYEGREYKTTAAVPNRGDTGKQQGGLQRTDYHPGGRNLRSVWTFATQPYQGAHFATFPEELARRCLLAGCPPGAWALDPFCGSGTTLTVAANLGRRAVGVEASGEYLKLAVARVKKGVRT